MELPNKWKTIPSQKVSFFFFAEMKNMLEEQSALIVLSKVVFHKQPFGGSLWMDGSTVL